MRQNGIAEEDDIIVNWLNKYGLPVNRKNYIDVMFPDGLPSPWTAEHEEQLPEDLQDWNSVQDDTETSNQLQT